MAGEVAVTERGLGNFIYTEKSLGPTHPANLRQQRLGWPRASVSLRAKQKLLGLSC